MRGWLMAFEGLDQSGKQTQAQLLAERLEVAGHRVRVVSFPDYRTPLGTELGRALAGERDYGADVMQLLYVANRFEWKPEIARTLDTGTMVICDRYVASSIAYGEAQGLDPVWLAEIQRYLPPPDLTVVLDIDPKTAVVRKAVNRDRFEQDLAMLDRVRASYRRQARADGWVLVDGERDRAAVAADVATAAERVLARR